MGTPAFSIIRGHLSDIERAAFEWVYDCGDFNVKTDTRTGCKQVYYEDEANDFLIDVLDGADKIKKALDKYYGD